ncbi:MAG: SBBP repeat-containing protein [Bacteroidetes bacterium]|nr:SBBP repeat-containing protein [Bacteroidota bacterium]
MRRNLTIIVILLNINFLFAQLNQEWAQTYGSSKVSASDNVKGITKDDTHVYITGAANEGVSTDLVTIKYTLSGTKEWIASYNGVDNSNDQANDIAVDASGNVYVVGYAAVTTNRDNIAIKYDNAGNEQWTVSYSGGSGFFGTKSNSVISSNQGGIVVTGSYFDTTVLIKYDASGSQQWLGIYQDPSGKYLEGIDLVEDAAGNVYVTGNIVINLKREIMTLKFNSLGVIEWSTRFKSIRSVTVNGIDIDDFGNVFITGKADTTGILFAQDMLLIKYDTNGNEDWLRLLDGPDSSSDESKAVVVDQDNNILITGNMRFAGFNSQFATFKFDNSGNQLWDAYWDGTAVGIESAWDIAVDDTRNVFVCGLGSGNLVTVKYDSSGNQIWDFEFNTPDSNATGQPYMVSDSNGEVYFTGGAGFDATANDYTTVNLSPAGMIDWVEYHAGRRATQENINDLAVDINEHIYITGHSDNDSSINDQDIVTIKYDKAGNELWRARYEGVKNAQGISIDADDQGNCYVAGYVNESFPDTYDALLLKYDTNGNLVWDELYDYEGKLDRGREVVATSNAIYVTGSSYDTSSREGVMTLKYDNSGNLVWDKRYVGDSTQKDIGKFIRIDNNGDIIIVGESTISFSDRDFLTIKYDDLGNEEWVTTYNGPDSAIDIPNDVVLDDWNNIIVTGELQETFFLKDIGVVKYDPTGNESWVYTYNHPDSVATGSGKALTVDGLGNIYVAGEHTDSITNHDVIAIKLDSNGNQQWIMEQSGSEVASDKVYDVVIDSLSNLTIFAGLKDSVEDMQLALISYTSTGSLIEVNIDPATGSSSDIGKAMVIHEGSQNVYHCGNIQPPGSIQVDFYTSKYIHCTGDIASFSYDNSTNILVFTDESLSANSWDWDFGDGNADTLQNPTHTYNVPGMYNVCLTINGACGEDTYCEEINATGIKDRIPSLVTIFPNPSEGSIQIISFIANIEKIEVLDMLGRTIYLQWINENNHSLDLSESSEGIYFIRIKTTNELITSKIVLSR